MCIVALGHVDIDAIKAIFSNNSPEQSIACADINEPGDLVFATKLSNDPRQVLLIERLRFWLMRKIAGAIECRIIGHRRIFQIAPRSNSAMRAGSPLAFSVNF